MHDWLFLAQVAPSTSAAPPTSNAATSQSGTAGGLPPPAKNNTDGVLFSPQFMIIILIAGLLYLFLFRGKSKDQKQQKAMIAALKRGDRVMTIGGLIGSVVEVRGEEVVLKVDESNNVKERYVKSAIQKVLGGDDKADESKK